MNKIIVEVSIGELLDKISILEIKLEKIKDPQKLKFITNEHSILKNQLDNNVESNDKLNELFQSLKEINTRLWKIEDDIRILEKEERFDNEFIELARAVYITNDKRFEIKNAINFEFSSEIAEVKSYEKY